MNFINRKQRKKYHPGKIFLNDYYPENRAG
jgi:hypothetical protein